MKDNLTGYASKDKPWLRYYEKGAYEKANNIPDGKTIWDVIEESLLKYKDIPALEYFKREISREDFIDSVYMWARSLRGMGIEEGEVVPIYTTFFPDIFAITCALNLIGATSYFLKLSMSKKDFEIETVDARHAIVFDGMWDNVKDIFSDDRFKKVIVITAADSMSRPKKELITFLNYIDQVKNNSLIPRKDKYIWVDDVKRMANYYTGNVRVPFVKDRVAFITSSSGTSILGQVKGTMATNEGTIAQLYQAENAGIHYYAGDKCLTNFPPTASTSLNCLFLLPIYRGMTLINDPRVSEKGFYKQMMSHKPNVALTTGSLWEAFFRNVEKELMNGKKVDLSNAKMWIIGGEGTNPTYFKRWNELMEQCGSTTPLFSGYGMSEVFSVLSVETIESAKDAKKKDTPVISVGVPYPGVNVKVVNEKGQEVKYGERGELLINSKAHMKGYYNKPSLTEKALVNDWVHTGDIFSIDENGILYLWGRADDSISLNDSKKLYMFDIANAIKLDGDINDAFVNAMPLGNGEVSLVAHVIFNDNFTKEKEAKFVELDSLLKSVLPEGISIDGYKEHFITFKCSPTTVKKDRKGLMKELDGYIKVIDNKVYNLEFEIQDDDKLIKKYSSEDKKILKRIKK